MWHRVVVVVVSSLPGSLPSKFYHNLLHATVAPRSRRTPLTPLLFLVPLAPLSIHYNHMTPKQEWTDTKQLMLLRFRAWCVMRWPSRCHVDTACYSSHQGLLSIVVWSRKPDCNCVLLCLPGMNSYSIYVQSHATVWHLYRYTCLVLIQTLVSNDIITITHHPQTSTHLNITCKTLYTQTKIIFQHN